MAAAGLLNEWRNGLTAITYSTLKVRLACIFRGAKTTKQAQTKLAKGNLVRLANSWATFKTKQTTMKQTLTILTLLILATSNLLAQKLSKEEKKRIKFCTEKTYSIDDPFSGEQIMITKFAEIFGIKEEFVRLGPDLYASARRQADSTTLIIRITMSGARKGETEKGTAHQFSFDLDGKTEVLELKTSENSTAAARAIGNQYGVSTVTDFLFKYRLSDEELNTISTGLLKGVKLKLDGNEVLSIVDNPDRALQLRKAIQCLN